MQLVTFVGMYTQEYYGLIHDARRKILSVERLWKRILRIPEYVCKPELIVIGLIANSFSIVAMLHNRQEALVYEGKLRCLFIIHVHMATTNLYSLSCVN